MIAWREASALVYYVSKYNVPTDLSVGIAKESRLNRAASSKGAIGVMQVMESAPRNAQCRDSDNEGPYVRPERGVEAESFFSHATSTHTGRSEGTQ